MSAVYAQPVGLADGRLVKAIALAGGDPLAALAYGEGQRAAWSTTPHTFSRLKSAVDALETSDPGSLAAARNLPELIGLVRAQTLLGNLTAVRRVPPNVAVPAVSGDVSSYLVGEGGAKPLSKFSTQTITVLPRKIVAAIVVSTELLRMSNVNAESGLTSELGKALALQVDRHFADPDLPGSISNGATTLSSTGNSLAQIDADLKSLLAVFATKDAALVNAVWAMSSTTATYLAALRGTGGEPAFENVGPRGGAIWGIPVLTSAALFASGSPGESEILLIDQNEILVADDSQIGISVAKSATVQLSDTPTSAAATQVSLFQAGLVGILAERTFGWGRVSSTAVAVLDGVQY